MLDDSKAEILGQLCKCEKRHRPEHSEALPGTADQLSLWYPKEFTRLAEPATSSANCCTGLAAPARDPEWASLERWGFLVDAHPTFKFPMATRGLSVA